MNRLEINLASNPFRNNMMFCLFHGMLIFLLLVITTLNIYFFMHFRTLRGEITGVLSTSQDEVNNLEKRAQRIKDIISKKDTREITEEAIFANDIILMRKFFWTDLFNKLEEVMPYSIRMQSIRPIFKERGIEVRVDGLAKDLKSFFEFEKNLQASPSFSRVRPESYRSVEGSDLTFSLAFEYNQVGKDMEDIFKEKEAFYSASGESSFREASIPEGEESTSSMTGEEAMKTGRVEGE
ncbi:MAG: hypothetical protein AB1756_00360 [Acidobacteriota bacterium]